jgi:phage terminase large subunit GpA-like protein
MIDMSVLETSPEAKKKIRTLISNAMKKCLSPPPRLNLVEWADTYRYLPDNSAEAGRWKTDRVHAVRQPMMSVSDPEVQEITVMSCIQFMKTELMLNTALFYMHQEPSPIMYVAPKKETAEAWSKERLVKSVNCTPVVSDIFTNNRRGEGNTITQKQFAGGQISIVSARNPTDLAMRACRIMLFDECDKYPINVGAGEQSSGGEGDPITVAWGRATTYGRRAKKITACSPTVQGKSRIEQEYKNSNMSVYIQPCPHCQHEKVLTWIDVLIPRDDKKNFVHKDAKISCSECGVLWTESDRHHSIRNGFWLATKPEITWHHGYKVSSLASPFTPVTILAKEFSDAQNNPEKLKAFYNTRMAEVWREVGEQPDWERLYERRENYSMEFIPDGGLLITCGIDVQKDHLYYEIMAWGRKKESWSLDVGVIDGNIESEETKEKLSEFLDQLLVNSKGVNVPIMKTCIDSGYNTNEVYSFCRGHGSASVVPVKGEDNLMTPIGTPTMVDVTVSGKRMSRGMQLWKVGSSVIKEQIYRWLNSKKPTDEDLKNGRTYPTGYCHYPQWDEEYFKQLTAEVYTKKTDNRGFFKFIWEKLRKDNHFLDCRVYNRAASAMLQIDRMTEQNWLELEESYSMKKVVKDETVTRDIRPKTRTKRTSNWIKQ